MKTKTDGPRSLQDAVGALALLGLTGDKLFERIRHDLNRGLTTEARSHLNFVDVMAERTSFSPAEILDYPSKPDCGAAPCSPRLTYEEIWHTAWNAAIEAALMKTPGGIICDPQAVADEIRSLISSDKLTP